MYLNNLITSFYIFVLALFLLPMSAFSDYDLVDLYRAKGIDLVLQKIEEKLQNREYWEKRLLLYDTSFGYFESLNYLFLSNKSVPSIDLYQYSNQNQFIHLDAVKAFVGQNRGIKTREGDLKTPVGVYFLEERLEKLDQFYGPLAFTTSYPNLYDKIQNRTGSGIWIHGLPIDNKNREDFTKGCIAIENNDIVRFDEKINSRLDKSVLIITEKKMRKVKKDDFIIILSSLYKWLNAWRINDIETYLSFYSENFTKYNGQKIEEFSRIKRIIFSRNEQKKIFFTDINIVPYPNPEKKNLFYVNFKEIYQSPSHEFEGLKELYVLVENNKLKIVVEK